MVCEICKKGKRECLIVFAMGKLIKNEVNRYEGPKVTICICQACHDLFYDDPTAFKTIVLSLRLGPIETLKTLISLWRPKANLARLKRSTIRKKLGYHKYWNDGYQKIFWFDPTGCIMLTEKASTCDLYWPK
jgi:hypothetical protein